MNTKNIIPPIRKLPKDIFMRDNTKNTQALIRATKTFGFKKTPPSNINTTNDIKNPLL